MKANMTLGVIVVLLVSVFPLHAQELRYLGKDVQDARKGWIEMQGQDYQVEIGTVISGWGTVTEVTDSHLITRYTLTEAEKENLRRQGAEVYHIVQIKIPHEALRIAPVPMR